MKIFLGILVGIAISIAYTSFADDTVPARPHDGVQMGVVADGEQVPVPQDTDTGAIQIFLSIRQIQDNNEILGRVECYLEPDGRTARVRNVNKFTGEIVATGTANYLLFTR